MILTREDEDNESQFKLVDNFLNKYRRFVNPNLLFVNVDLSGASAKVRLESPDQDEEHMFAHANDIYIAGFSEQLLQFIAERGNNAQLQHVSAIDKAYQLDKVKVHLPDPPKPNNCQEEEFYCECDSDIQNALTRPQVLHSVIEFGLEFSNCCATIVRINMSSIVYYTAKLYAERSYIVVFVGFLRLEEEHWFSIGLITTRRGVWFS